jgi:glycosyltransferase involved in cell wall biosynthesis
MAIIQLVDFYFPNDAMSKLAKSMHTIDLTIDKSSLLAIDIATPAVDMLNKDTTIRPLYMRSASKISYYTLFKYFLKLKRKREYVSIYLQNLKHFDKDIGKEVDNAKIRVWHNPQHFPSWWRVQRHDIIFWHNFTYPYLIDAAFANTMVQELPRLKLYNDLDILWLTHSKFNLNSLRHYGIDPEHYEILPAPHLYNLPFIEHSTKEPHLLVYSRYGKNKAHPEVAQFAKEHKYNLTMFGDNTTALEYYKEYQKAKELASPNARILSKQSNETMEYLFQQTNIYLSNSKHEGMGYPIIEAYAHSLPVIVRGDTAMSEFVEEGQTGFTFDDINEVPALIDKIMKDYKRFSHNAWKHSQNYTYEKFKERYLRILKEYEASK